MPSQSHDRLNTRRIRRREMLRGSLYGVAASSTIPAFLGQTFFGMQAHADSVPPSGSDGPIVVIIQMGGGNDGLNTVVPIQGTAASIYQTERPNLGIPFAETLPLAQQPDFGLHPKLTGLKSLWDTSELAIVQGVGYPNPNLSHFTSFDYWHTAQPNEPVRDGWLGRFFDHQCSGVEECDPTLGIELGGNRNFALKSDASNASLTISDPSTYDWRSNGLSKSEPEMERAFHRLVGLKRPDAGVTASTPEGLAYVKRVAVSALQSATTVQCAIERAESAPASFPAATFPGTRLGNDLRNIAALIYGGMGTSVYYANQSGYDTHGAQFSVDGAGDPLPLTGRHADLLEEFDGALAAFAAEMKAQGVWDRVLILTFSEFGRKVIENGSNGSDHGAASCLFAAGGGVKGKDDDPGGTPEAEKNYGMYGVLPSLAAPDRIKNDSLRHNVDFRRVYRSVLENWLNVPSVDISQILPSAPLDENFDPVPFV